MLRTGACLWASVGAVGCAITPQPVFGSAMAAGQVAPGAAWGTSLGPSRARVVAANGTVHEIRGNGDSIHGDPPLHPGLVVPLCAVVRAAVSPRLDLGSHVGWYGAGVGTRVRLTDPAAPHAAYITADGQVGYALPHDDRSSRLGVPYVGRLLQETAVSLGRHWQLLGALGLSAGYRRHGVLARFMEPASIDNVLGAENTFAVLRPELRLEGGLGGYFTARRFGVQAMVVPYLVLAHGRPTAECLHCTEAARFEAFRQSWGVTVLLNPFALLGPID